MMRLAPLEEADPQAIEALLDRAFGTGRKARTAYRLREGTAWLPALSFALFAADGTLTGSIQAWPVRLVHDGGDWPLVMVGPVAVDPQAQGLGHGKRLMTALIAAAARERVDAMMMIGDPEYYGRFFGFAAGATAGWYVPGPVERDRLLARIAAGVEAPVAGRLLPG